MKKAVSPFVQIVAIVFFLTFLAVAVPVFTKIAPAAKAYGSLSCAIAVQGRIPVMRFRKTCETSTNFFMMAACLIMNYAKVINFLDKSIFNIEEGCGISKLFYENKKILADDLIATWNAYGRGEEDILDFEEKNVKLWESIYASNESNISFIFSYPLQNVRIIYYYNDNSTNDLENENNFPFDLYFIDNSYGRKPLGLLVIPYLFTYSISNPNGIVKYRDVEEFLFRMGFLNALGNKFIEPYGGFKVTLPKPSELIAQLPSLIAQAVGKTTADFFNWIEKSIFGLVSIYPENDFISKTFFSYLFLTLDPLGTEKLKYSMMARLMREKFARRIMGTLKIIDKIEEISKKCNYTELVNYSQNISMKLNEFLKNETFLMLYFYRYPVFLTLNKTYYDYVINTTDEYVVEKWKNKFVELINYYSGIDENFSFINLSNTSNALDEFNSIIQRKRTEIINLISNLYEFYKENMSNYYNNMASTSYYPLVGYLYLLRNEIERTKRDLTSLKDIIIDDSKLAQEADKIREELLNYWITGILTNMLFRDPEAVLSRYKWLSYLMFPGFGTATLTYIAGSWVVLLISHDIDEKLDILVDLNRTTLDSRILSNCEYYAPLDASYATICCEVDESRYTFCIRGPIDEREIVRSVENKNLNFIKLFEKDYLVFVINPIG